MCEIIFDAISNSPEQTENIAAELAKSLPKDAFLAMYGDLGAGKTAFVRGLARVIVPDAVVSSPTYALVNEYRGADTRLSHFDMYRITSEDDLYSIGFFDYTDCMICAEWCENIPYALPDDYYRVTITKLNTNDSCDLEDKRPRSIKIEHIC